MTDHVMTKATLAPAAANLGALLAKAGATDGGHALVWTLFSTDRAAKRDFLYRAVDARTFLVVSPRPASDPHAIWHMRPQPYRPEPQVGERYSFILRANPSVDISRAGRQRSQRVDAVMHAKNQARAEERPWSREAECEAALSWLYAREANLGVRFVREGCAASSYRQMRIPRGIDEAKSQGHIAISTVDFEGLLVVTAPAHLIARLTEGIGRGRAIVALWVGRAPSGNAVSMTPIRPAMRKQRGWVRRLGPRHRRPSSSALGRVKRSRM